MQMIHSSEGPIQAGIDEQGLAFAELYDAQGVVQRFEEQVDTDREDPYETVRRQHSRAIALRSQREAEEARKKRIAEQSEILKAAFEDEAALDRLADKVAQRLIDRQQ